ncbi:deltex [Mytilus galloprovincialis]|uniref:E3 ubiquitin-protein ligase n=2 Tax=Mytilus galloprovincialis TaxID=29158 RepID=A0A8B6GXW4_MYTGA|nr:deltex [Mytilus galloprovincialis]
MKMSQSSTNVIVWEWMNEFGRWRPYEPNVTQYIENAYQNNSNQVNLSAADSSLSSYAIDFVTTCQIRLGTGTARPIRRSTYPPSSLPGKGIVWQWEGDVRGQWHIYDMEVGCLIEDYYSQTPRTNIFDLSKSALKLPYHIDFSKMIQIRIETGRVRKVRRATTKLAYPSGNGTNSPPQHSSVSMVSTASTSSNGASNSSSKSPTKSSGTSPSPTKKFKSGHTNSQTATAPNPIGAATSNNVSNFNPSAVYTTASQSFNHVTPNYGNTPSSQNSNQVNLAYGRRLTRSFVNANSMPQSMANQMPQNMTNQNVSHMGQGNSNIGQNNNTFPNFTPNMTMNPSSQYQNMPQMGMAGNMNNNIGNMQPSNFPIGPSNAVGQAFYGGQAMSAQYGMFPVHHGLPGGSIVNMARSGHPAASSGMTYPSGSSTAVRSGSQHLDIPEEAKIPNINSRQSKKQGKTSDTEIFEQFTEVIQHPPADEDCCICCEKLSHASGYGEGQMENHVVYQLNKCSHMFHKLCLIAMYDSGSKNGSMQCPACKTIYGEKHGNCPKGVMEYCIMSQALQGFPDSQTIRILYHISPGVQTQEHPHPGKRFTCRGFPRVCFLPDNDEGRKILKLLIVAWKRRLTFTIGHSTTTGETDTVTWNEIHHKTEFGSNISGHGFPDDKYFDNVLQELSVQGVTEKDI